MRDPFKGYDEWLERPYQEMMDDSDKFVDWAESEGYDLDDPAQLQEAEDDYMEYIESMADDYAEAQYERYLDRLEMEDEERDYDEG